MGGVEQDERQRHAFQRWTGWDTGDRPCARVARSRRGRTGPSILSGVPRAHATHARLHDHGCREARQAWWRPRPFVPLCREPLSGRATAGAAPRRPVAGSLAQALSQPLRFRPHRLVRLVIQPGSRGWAVVDAYCTFRPRRAPHPSTDVYRSGSLTGCRREPAGRFLPSRRPAVPVVTRTCAARHVGPARHRRPETAAPPAPPRQTGDARPPSSDLPTQRPERYPSSTGVRQEDPSCVPRLAPPARSPWP
jgi:hypothetical protein